MHEEILRRVLNKITPSQHDRAKLRLIANKIVQRAREKAERLGIKVNNILVVGSAARDTWLKDEKDIDILFLFPEDMSEEEMETFGMQLARKVAGPKGKEEYAEHPYVKMLYKGFEIDLVPCFDVSDPSRIKSALDRTPYHQKYILAKMTEKSKSEVLLLKQFARGIGVYGAEAKVQGFSGYLCELLILHYGSFMELVKNASDWRHGEIIDIESHHKDKSVLSKLFPNQPLIVIDPVDSSRNVAAAVSFKSFGIFIQACRDFLRSPSINFFFPKPVQPITKDRLYRILRQRETSFIILYLKHGGLSSEIIYPQLRKTARVLQNSLVQRGFSILRGDVWADNENAAILIESFPKRLPEIEARIGPRLPIDASRFIQTYLNSDNRISGPMITESGNFVFEVKRKYREPFKVVKDQLKQCFGFGKDVATIIHDGKYELLEGQEAAKFLKNRNFRMFLSEYFDGRLPWYR